MVLKQMGLIMLMINAKPRCICKQFLNVLLGLSRAWHARFCTLCMSVNIMMFIKNANTAYNKLFFSFPLLRLFCGTIEWRFPPSIVWCRHWHVALAQGTTRRPYQQNQYAQTHTPVACTTYSKCQMANTGCANHKNKHVSCTSITFSISLYIMKISFKFLQCNIMDLGVL